MAANEKDMLMKADHVKVYFKGKNKRSGTVKAVDDISFEIMRGGDLRRCRRERLRKKYSGTYIDSSFEANGRTYLSGRAGYCNTERCGT